MPLEEFQVSVALAPLATVLGVAESETLGGRPMEGSLALPPPQATRETAVTSSVAHTATRRASAATIVLHPVIAFTSQIGSRDEMRFDAILIGCISK